MVKHILSAIRLGRPLFLGGGMVLYWLGVVMAMAAGAQLNLTVALWGQAAVTAIQLMTHYCNDYFDLAADIANQTPTNWSGGSRVLPDGLLPPRVALLIALSLAGMAGTLGVILAVAVRPGIDTFILIFGALILAWSYSAPPLRLHSRGLGELVSALLVTGLTPLVGYYLQSGQLGRPLLGVIPLGLFQFAMLLAIEFPDAAGDRAAGKNTLVVLLGGLPAARLHGLALLLAYALLPFLGLPAPVAIWASAGLPVAAWQAVRVWRNWANPVHWNSIGFWAVALLIGNALAQLAGWIIVYLERYG